MEAAGDTEERLALHWPQKERSALDGAWWPRTRDMEHEAVALCTELSRRGVHAYRLAYSLSQWEKSPRRAVVAGRTLRLGGFLRIDPHLVSLSIDESPTPFDLLVIPPETSEDTALRAMHVASRENSPRASQVLQDAAHS